MSGDGRRPIPDGWLYEDAAGALREHGYIHSVDIRPDGDVPIYLGTPGIVREAHAETGWRPIETAPKDETPILTYRGAGLMSVAAYFPDPVGSAEWCCTDGIHLRNVTHWMPLPEPPEES